MDILSRRWLTGAAYTVVSEGVAGTDGACKAPIRKSGPQLRQCGVAGAVCWGEALDVQATESGDSCVHALGAGVEEMKPTHDGVNGTAAGELPDVFKGVHHAGVGAAEQDHQAGFGVEVKGLVVGERVGLGAGGIELETAAGVFEGVRAGD